jgi:multidrug efflux pump subunit AcrB
MSEEQTGEAPSATDGSGGSRARGLWRLIAGVVERPVTVTMITIALLLFGLVALTRMPVELLPELGYPSITVQTQYPDAAPAEVEELVTRPIEELVGAVPGLVSVESTSREGLSEVVLDFAWGTRIDDAMADVREKLDRVRLPIESERPIVLRYDPSQEPILRLALVVESGDGVTNFKAMRDLADEDVKQVLEKLDGVAAVQLHGGDEEEVVVELDPDRLAALGIDASEIVLAIGADNINRPGGGLTDDGNRYLIRTVHEAKTPEQLGEIIIREGTSGVGGRLRLRDLTVNQSRGIRRTALEREEVSLVATGMASSESGEAERATAGPSEAIELAVFREGDANTVRVAEQVLERVEQMRKQLPEGHSLVVLSNQARFIDAAIEEVALNTLIGGGLAILVLLFFLRDLRSTLVIGAAIPISLLVTFVPLSILEVSLNLMSLGGLALGVGMLVDNSIVTLESIARVRDEHGLSRTRSAVRGTVEIANSVVASTLTTVAVFFPMAFVDGVAGQLVRDLAYAVSFSIISSMIVSLTLVPVLQALGSDEDVPEPEGKSKRSLIAWLVAIPALLWIPIRLLVRGIGWLLGMLARPLTKGWDLLEGTYPTLLRVALRARVPVLLASVAICVVVVAAGRDLGRTLLPEVRQGEIYVQLELPQGTSLERTTALTRAIMRELESDDRLDMVFARAGSMTQGGSATGGQVGTHLAQINVRLRDELSASAQLDATEDELFVLLSEISERTLDGMEHRVRLGRPELLSFESPIEIQVFADESEDAVAHALRLLPRLREVEGLADISADDLSGRPEVRIDFERERLGRAGLDVDRAATAVQRAIQGELAGVMHAVDKQLDIRVRLPEVDRSDVEDVERIQVGVIAGSTNATTGQVTPPKSIPLVAVAQIEPGMGPAEIRRIDGRRGLRIRARAAFSPPPSEGPSRRVAAGDLAALAAQIEDTLDVTRAEIPVGSFVEAELAGQAEEMSSSLQSLAFTALLAIFLVYVVMASSFESLHHPFLIMFTVPLAAVGVVLACLLTNTPISAMVGIGGIILGGIVVNNAIVLVDAVNQRRGRGMDVNAALVDAARVRVRPILMTTATTVLGLLPMAFGVGEGAALRQPLALSVIGGLVVSTALTLIVIPVVYSLAPGRKRAAWGDVEPT